MFRLWWKILACCVGVSSCSTTAPTLILDGKPVSVIVIPDDAPAPAGEAAQLLQMTLEKMSGCQIPIVEESQCTEQPSQKSVWIAVGNTQLARSKDILPESLRPEGIVLQVQPAYIIITGNDDYSDAEGSRQNGPYYAAVEFLERLGVRWLWPGELGEVIPEQKTVIVEQYAYRYTPKLVQRHFRLDNLGRGIGETKYGFQYDDSELTTGDWGRNMRLGYSRRIRATHGFGNWFRDYFESHPEYFAVGEDGKSYGWISNVDRCKLCISNEGTFNQLMQNIRASYDQYAIPSKAFYSLSPNDNQTGYCMCEHCRAMDAMDGPEVEWRFWNAVDGPGRSLEDIHRIAQESSISPFQFLEGKNLQLSYIKYVSLTDRYVKFWNKVATQAEQEYPGLQFGAIAYGVYRNPPLHVRVHDNVLIGAVFGGNYINENTRQEDLGKWDAWSEKAAQMMSRPNGFREGRGFPLLWPLRQAEDMKHFIQKNMISIDMPNIHNHWATQGLNAYVLAKILWDPSLYASDIIEDYCERGFGDAATAVKKYVYKLIDLTDAVAIHNAAMDARVEKFEDPDAGDRTETLENVSAWESVYTSDVMLELDSFLQEALQAAGTNELVRRRVEFLQTGFEYAGLDLLFKKALARYRRNTEENERQTEILRTLVNLDAWKVQNSRTLAVGVIAGYYWFEQQYIKLNLPFIRNFQPQIIRENINDGVVKLELLAYSRKERVSQMRFSADGKQWSNPEQFMRFKTMKKDMVPRFVQFRLEGASSYWSAPVPII